MLCISLEQLNEFMNNNGIGNGQLTVDIPINLINSMYSMVCINAPLFDSTDSLLTYMMYGSNCNYLKDTNDRKIIVYKDTKGQIHHLNIVMNLNTFIVYIRKPIFLSGRIEEYQIQSIDYSLLWRIYLLEQFGEAYKQYLKDTYDSLVNAAILRGESSDDINCYSNFIQAIDEGNISYQPQIHLSSIIK